MRQKSDSGGNQLYTAIRKGVEAPWLVYTSQGASTPFLFYISNTIRLSVSLRKDG